MNHPINRNKSLGIISSIVLAMFILLTICPAKAAALSDTNSPESVWNTFKSCLETNNIQGAVSCFSVASKGDYQRTFSSMSKADMQTYVKGLGPIKKASMENDSAQYYFEHDIDGKTITFPVEFGKENGVWKIKEF